MLALINKKIKAFQQRRRLLSRAAMDRTARSFDGEYPAKAAHSRDTDDCAASVYYMVESDQKSHHVARYSLGLSRLG